MSYRDSYSPREWIIHAIRFLDKTMTAAPGDIDRDSLEAIGVLVRAMVTL